MRCWSLLTVSTMPFLLLLSTNAAFSVVDSTETQRLFPFEDNTQALQFHLVGQVAASYKFHFSPRSAVRLTADISGVLTDERKDISYDPGSTLSYDVRRNTQGLRINPSYLHYFYDAGRLKPFLGAGPFIGFNRNYWEYSSKENDRPWSTYAETTTTWQFGLAAHAGVECFLTDYLSILAEYELDASYEPSTVERSNQSSHSTDETNTWKVELTSLRIGIGFYW